LRIAGDHDSVKACLPLTIPGAADFKQGPTALSGSARRRLHITKVRGEERRTAELGTYDGSSVLITL
jgi:hypothetical protein